MVLHQLSGDMEITFYIRFLCIPNHNFCWMNHFNPILNKYNTIKKKLKAKVTERKEQLIFQAQCSTDKDMTNLSKKYDQLNNNLDIRRNQPARTKKKSYDIEL